MSNVLCKMVDKQAVSTMLCDIGNYYIVTVPVISDYKYEYGDNAITPFYLISDKVKQT